MKFSLRKFINMIEFQINEDNQVQLQPLKVQIFNKLTYKLENHFIIQSYNSFHNFF